MHKTPATSPGATSSLTRIQRHQAAFQVSIIGRPARRDVEQCHSALSLGQLQTREIRAMPNTRLPDCRPPRRDDSITSASSHPELLVGEIVLRPRLRVPLSAAERDMLSTWRKRVLAVYGLLAAALAAAIMGQSMFSPSTRTAAQGVSKDEQARTEICVQHTGALSDAGIAECPGQVAIQGTMPTCASADAPANSRGASTRQPQAN